MTTTFTDPALVRQQVGLPDDPPPAENARLAAALLAATAHVEAFAGRWFSPRFAALRHHPERRRHEVILRADLLQLLALTDGDQHVPLDRLTLIDGGAVRRADGGLFFNDHLTVTGWWGWHDTPAHAWLDSGDYVAGTPLAASHSTVRVTDASALLPDGVTPRFAVGCLLRLADEIVQITAIDAANDRLTLQRALNGTTAALHPLFTPIYRYQPPALPQSLIVRWAAWRYRQPDLPPQAIAPAELVAEAFRLARPRVR